MSKLISIRSVLSVVGVLFFLAMLTGYHGFSIRGWTRFIEVPAADNNLTWGAARHNRGDDWAHDIPYQLSQVQNRFAIQNPFVGAGQNMLLPNKVPVWHWITFARPSMWGYFLGPDWGLTWAWCFLAMGTFLTAFWLFLVLSHHNAALSLALALAFVFSPPLQFWSYHKSEVFIHGTALLLGARWFFSTRGFWSVAASATFCAYMLIGFCLHQVYPGLQVAYGYALSALALGLFFAGEWKVSVFSHAKRLALLGAIAVSGVFLWSVWLEVRPLVAELNATVYPGQRLSTGGVGYPWLLLSSNFFVAAFLRRAFGILGNVCESATAIHIAPLALLALGASYVRGSRASFAFFVPLLGITIVFLVYLCFGFPLWLAHVSLLGKMTENRLPQILIFLEFVFLCRFLANPAYLSPLSKRDRFVVLALWMSVLGVHASLLASHIVEFKPLYLAFSLFVNAVLGGLLLFPRRSSNARFLVCFVGLSVAYTAGFNPMNFGASTRYLFTNPVSKELVRLSPPDGKDFWAVVGPSEQSISISNLPRILGVRSLGGAVGEPQLELWKRFSPLTEQSTYNRLTYTYLTLSNSHEPIFTNTTPNELQIAVSPDSPAWDRVGVTRVMAWGDFTAWDTSRNWKRASCTGKYCFYARRIPQGR